MDRLKTVREKRILKLCLVQESDISAKYGNRVLLTYSAMPEACKLQPDYVSSYFLFYIFRDYFRLILHEIPFKLGVPNSFPMFSVEVSML